MTGFDETVPPDLDPDADATSAEDATYNTSYRPGAAGNAGLAEARRAEVRR